MAISGASIGVGTLGALLVYAGISGKNPLTALKDISTGNVALPAPKSSNFLTGILQGALSDQQNLIQQGITASGNSQLVAAAYTHKDEVYSQARRWENGFSDCSSFVGKSLKDIGITPPGASVTMNYMVWSKAKTVSRSAIQPGDLLCSSGHIAIATTNGQAIGQQRPGRNVQVDTIANIMYGQAGWIPRRITSIAATPQSGGVASA